MGSSLISSPVNTSLLQENNPQQQLIVPQRDLRIEANTSEISPPTEAINPRIKLSEKYIIYYIKIFILYNIYISSII